MKTKYEFFEIEIEDHIAIVYLNKPEKRNAMDCVGLTKIAPSFEKV